MEWYWWVIVIIVVIISIPLKLKFIKWYSKQQQEKKNWGESDE